MKRLLYSFTFLLLFLSACVTPREYTQLYETKASFSSKSGDNSSYIFENDTVMITYSFWAERGIMYFEIYNKLNIPLYIDWKKSSLIKNADKYDYWADMEKTKTSSFYQEYGVEAGFWKTVYTELAPNGTINYGYPYWLHEKAGESFSTSSNIKPERITFIAPESNYRNFQYTFLLYPKPGTKLKINKPYEEVLTKDYYTNKSIPTKIYKSEYTEGENIFDFRNFLTLSTSEKFEKEFYIDNAFYVSRILEMDKMHFTNNLQEYSKASSFYINIPRGASIESRKQNNEQ